MIAELQGISGASMEPGDTQARSTRSAQMRNAIGTQSMQLTYIITSYATATICQAKLQSAMLLRSCNAFEQNLGGYLSLATIEIQVVILKPLV